METASAIRDSVALVRSRLQVSGRSVKCDGRFIIAERRRTSQSGTQFELRHLTLAIALLQVAGLAACVGDTPANSVVVRDSADIRIVENPAPSSSGTQSWTLDSIPALEIGAEPNDPTQQFVRVGDVRLLDGGQVVVADEGAEEVLMFDLAANFLRAVARRGQGPGELTNLRGLYRCAEDTLVVNDFYRVSVFDREGRFARSERIIFNEDERILRIEGVSSDCSTFLLRTSSLVLPPAGEVGRLPTTLFWGSLDNTRRDTIAIVSIMHVIRQNISGYDQPLPLPWGTRAHWAIGRHHVYVGISNRLEIRVYDREANLTRIIRWAGESRPVTSTDRQLFAQKRARWVQERPSLGEVILRLDDFPAVPKEMPAFLSLLVDDQENLWVRDYPRWVAGWPEFYETDLKDPPEPDDDPEIWTVFDGTGRLLATVRIPLDLAVRSVHGDYVLTVWRDPYDVERVRLYRLNKRAGS